MSVDVIEMNHGSGGRAMEALIESIFRREFSNSVLSQANDYAALPSLPAGQLVMSTDNFVVSPLFFPGGDIGSLAVHGTVNDIAMSGARPLYLSAGFILEEGFPIADLTRIAQSMASAARGCGVQIVTGDTKVVERGKGDGVYINTAGVGVRHEALEISASNVQPGDAVIFSGPIGAHGIALLTQRENLSFGHGIQSDSAALNTVVEDMVTKLPSAIHCMRDATRGGVAAVLNEICLQSKVSIEINEASIPIQSNVEAACELLGLDPLNIANEGMFVCFCAAQGAQDILQIMKRHSESRGCAIVGKVTTETASKVSLRTQMGGRRLVQWPQGELLPRIC